MASNAKINSVNDYEDVVAAVNGYVSGLRVGSVSELKKPFHENAVMYGFIPGQLLEGSVKNLYDYVENYGAAKDIKTHLDVIGITPTTAVVRVDMENDAAGGNFTDFHALIKVDGSWRVVAKLFHQYSE